MVEFKQVGVHFIVSERNAAQSHARCTDCGVRLLYLLMPSGARNPIDLERAERLDSGELRCVSNFATCPKAAKFRERRAKPKTACPVEACAGTVRHGELMCAGCWKLVPKRMRDEVWRTWKVCQAGGPREAWKTYEGAAAAAVTTVNAAKANRKVRQLDAFGGHGTDPG